MNITPTDFERVVADCDEAIALDKTYVKALNRRAVSLENLERLEDSLRGNPTNTRLLWCTYTSF